MQKLRLFGMNGFFTLMLALTALVGHGQQAGYLILIDADNKQPFIARIGENQMASSTHGHLIIPQLQDSSYRVCIRFPREGLPEQIFPVKVNKKDRGFQLQGSDSTWVLYNWQSKEVIHPLKELDSSRLLDQGVKREDGFSRLMAAVVNDTSVMYNSFTEAFSKDTVAARRPSADSSTRLVAAVVKTPVDSAKRKPAAVPKKAVTGVKKLREVSLKISRKMVFLDRSAEGNDTVTLFIFFESEPGVVRNSKPAPAEAQPATVTDSAVQKPVEKAREKGPVPAKETAREKEPAPGKETVKTTVVDSARRTAPADSVVRKMNPSCHQEATDPDAEALRSAILTANTLQDKISVSSGAFLMKCFSSDQVRSLAGLFVSDPAKYRFLEAARGHVSDPGRFAGLGDLLTDKNFQKKFTLLLQKKG